MLSNNVCINCTSNSKAPTIVNGTCTCNDANAVYASTNNTCTCKSGDFLNNAT